MAIDRDSLADALDELKGRPFPGHPDDPNLADWVLELTELDGHIAGLAIAALGSSRALPTESHDVAEHARRLADIRVVGDDERVYDDCLSYIEALKRVEDVLGGRHTSRG